MGWKEKRALVQAAAARTFGEEIRYEPDGLSALDDLPAIFYDQTELPDLDVGSGSIVRAPGLELQRSLLPRDPLGIDETGARDVVVVSGTRYAVATWEDDGAGMLTLNLRLES